MTTVLVLVENLDTYLPILESSGFQLIRAPTAEQRAEFFCRGNGCAAAFAHHLRKRRGLRES